MNGKTMMYVIDSEYKILYANESFRRAYPDIKCGDYCYNALGRYDSACPMCPMCKEERENIFYNNKLCEWVKSQVSDIEWEGNPDCHAVICKNWRVGEDFDEPEIFYGDKLSELEVKNRFLLRQNDMLAYINDELPGGFHQCKIEDGYPFIRISNQMLRMLGFTEGDIAERFENKFVNLVHPNDRKLFEPLLQEPDLEVGNVMEFRYRMRCKNGYMWVKDVTKLCEYDGKRFYQGTILNITHEIEAQSALKQSNREMGIILGSIPGGMKISKLDDDLTFKYISNEAAALFGYTPDELMEATGGSAKKIIYPPDLAGAEIRAGKVRGQDEDFTVKYRAVCKDGSLKYIMECGKIITDENGEQCINSLYLDVTKERETEDLIKLQNALIASQAVQKKQKELNSQQTAIINALSRDYKSVYFTDLDMDKVTVFRMETFISDRVRSAIEMSDYCYSYSISAYIDDCVHNDDRENMKKFFSIENFKKELVKKDAIFCNYRVCRDGKTVYYQAKCVRYDEDGDITKVILGFRDVDEEVRLAMEQKQALADALKQAEYASGAKTVFLNNMSHDIRTPMNAIIGFTALASTHIDNKDRVRDYLAKIAQSSNHLLSLINDVLDMSRIEAGKMRLDEKPENLAEIMQNMRNIIQTDIHSKQLELYIDTVDVQDEDIFCDKLRLNQVLLNLISNAIKFTEPGGTVSVRIKQLANVQNGYGEYEFRVKDNGIGMSKSFCEHIFEPFTRESTSTVSGIQGTGLGMSITKNIIDMMNGKIDVSSEQGRGTEITVNLKFKLQKEHRKFGVIKKLEGLRCLVVDDDMCACQSVAKMLRQIGLRAEWTMYGKEAIVRTQEAVEIGDSYSIYIIDCFMPDMNGIETSRRIRRIVGSEAPIIILSAYDWADLEDEAREAGVTDFVSKPLFASDLHRVLMKACGDAEEELADEEHFNRDVFEGKRVLLTEDNELNREIACEILNMAGIEVENAENGEVAVKMFTESDEGYYDLILMDVQMPVMNGYEATEAIRSLDRDDAKCIPIFAMTANAFAEDIHNAEKAGMNEHLAKPLSPERLINTLEKWFTKSCRIVS